MANLMNARIVPDAIMVSEPLALFAIDVYTNKGRDRLTMETAGAYGANDHYLRELATAAGAMSIRMATGTASTTTFLVVIPLRQVADFRAALQPSRSWGLYQQVLQVPLELAPAPILATREA